MKRELNEAKVKEIPESPAEKQEWQNWELSPVWSPSDAKATSSGDSAGDNVISADSVQRALDRLGN